MVHKTFRKIVFGCPKTKEYEYVLRCIGCEFHTNVVGDVFDCSYFKEDSD